MTSATTQPSIPTARIGVARSVKKRAAKNYFFVTLCIISTWASVAILLVLLAAIVYMGYEHLDWNFLQNAPSRKPELAGIKPALFGSVCIAVVCTFFTLPIGVGTAVLLEEFKPKKPFIAKLHNLIQINISNLAGVPSIVYGILGLTAFVQMFGAFGNPMDPAFELGTRENWYYIQIPFGRGILAGGLTLMLVVLPVVIVSAQEALRAVPYSLREGGLALGASKWQAVSKIVLPAAVPGIMTGAILAISRAIGEAAPILVIAGIVYITFTPEHLMDDFTAMPLQIYDWAGRPQEEFHKVAATGIIVLLSVLLSMNTLAVYTRQKFQKQLQ